MMLLKSYKNNDSYQMKFCQMLGVPCCNCTIMKDLETESHLDFIIGGRTCTYRPMVCFEKK